MDRGAGRGAGGDGGGVALSPTPKADLQTASKAISLPLPHGLKEGWQVVGNTPFADRISGAATKLLRVAAVATLLIAGTALAQSHVGDRVRVWVSGDYYAGTIKEIGTGSHAGQYLIDFDKYATDQYALAKNVLPLGAAPAAARSNGKRGSNGCSIMLINGLPVCDPATVRRR